MGYLDRQAKRADKARQQAARKAAWEALTPKQRQQRIIITLAVIGVIVIIAAISAAVSGKSPSASYQTTVTQILPISNSDLRVFWTTTNNGKASGTPGCSVTVGSPSSSYWGIEDASPNNAIPPGGSENSSVDITVTNQGAQDITQNQVSVSCS